MYFWNKWPNTIVVFAKAAVVAYRRVTMLTILNQEIPNRFLNQKMQNSAFSWCTRIFKEGGSGISCCWPCSEKVLGKSLSWMGILWSIFGMPACSNYTCVTQERYLEGWFSLPAILAIFCQVLTKAFSAPSHLFFFFLLLLLLFSKCVSGKTTIPAVWHLKKAVQVALCWLDFAAGKIFCGSKTPW